MNNELKIDLGRKKPETTKPENSRTSETPEMHKKKNIIILDEKEKQQIPVSL